MSSSQPSSEVTAWKRGDLVLVDGTREGAVVSVNGNMAQVSLWDAQAAAVNVARLSPLEPTLTIPPPAAARVDEPWLQSGDVIDAAPGIRCYPEAGIVLDSRDGPVLTVDPLDGGDCWVVHMGDVARWLAEHGAGGFQPTDTVTLYRGDSEEEFILPTHIAESAEMLLRCASVGDEDGLREHLAPLLRRLSVPSKADPVPEPALCPGCRRRIWACNADAPDSPTLTMDCRARRSRLLTAGPKRAKSLSRSLLKGIADGPPQWLPRRDPLVQAVLADSLCFIACTSGLDYVTLAPTHKGLTLLETQE